MISTDIFIILGSLSLVIIAVSLVPAVVQMRRTFKKAEELLETLNHDVKPLCKSMSGAASELEILTVSLNDKIDRTGRIFDTLEQSADTLLLTSNMVRETVRPLITNIGGMTAGVRAFAHFFNKPRREP